MKIVAENRKARHDYTVLETFEAGIELKGTEVKSMRAGKANMKDSFAAINNGELFLYNMHISPYEQRKLLMHRQEIMRLLGKIKEQGLTLIPLKAYFKGDRIKIELGLCKGKKLYDKRDAAAEKTARREIDRAMKERSRGY